MTRNELERDPRFKRICSKYDIYTTNATVFGDLILLNSVGKDIYILLDKDYNTLAIEKAYITNVNKFINSLYNEYKTYVDNFYLPYPFDKLTFQQIVDISNRITISEEIERKVMTINNIDCIYKKNDDYSRLLAYIKFLGKEIRNYQSYLYFNKVMGIEVVDVASHIKTLIEKINVFIELSVKNKKVICVDELIEYMNNEDYEYYEYKFLLQEVINLLLKQKGYKIENQKFQRTPTSNLSNLSEKSYQLIEILKMTKVENRYKIRKYKEEEAKDIFEILSFGDKTFNIKKFIKTDKKILNKKRIWHKI